MPNGKETPTIGERIRALRERRGWTQGQLAERSGLSEPTISRLESGKRKLSRHATLQQIATALGVTTEEIGGVRSMPAPQSITVDQATQVPVVRARIQASSSTEWDDTRETVFIRATHDSRMRNLLAAIVTGHCMSPFVNDGDTIVFDPSARHPVDGQMVVVSLDSGELMVKWARTLPDGSYVLRAADGSELRPNGARLEGVVIKIIREPMRDPGAPLRTLRIVQDPTLEP